MTTVKELNATLTRMKANDRIALIRIAVPDDACPVCQSLQGAYPKEATPILPPEGCSCPHGSRAHYEPVLTEIYP